MGFTLLRAWNHYKVYEVHVLYQDYMNVNNNSISLNEIIVGIMASWKHFVPIASRNACVSMACLPELNMYTLFSIIPLELSA